MWRWAVTPMAEPEWVWRDGSRLTPWMDYQIGRLDADFYKKWGVHIRVTSGIRTCAEQERIFRHRYRIASQVNGRKVYDTRVWNGARWYRIDKTGTVAVPCTSNHNIQGSNGAADLHDTGSDPGITRAGNPRSDWLRANAHKYDMVPEGYGFEEPWHYLFRNIFKSPPIPGGNDSPSGKGTAVKHYPRRDHTVRNGGRTVAPGGSFWLNITEGAAKTRASNLVGGIGLYSITAHVYAKGKPGDAVDLQLFWDDTKTSGPHSGHYVERLVLDGTGVIRASVEFKRAVASGEAVYARLLGPASNKGSVVVTLFDSDAYLFA